METQCDASALSTALAQVDLGQYTERLLENGFDDWETLTAITEADMIELGFKLGDRRKLQHAIRERSHSGDYAAERSATDPSSTILVANRENPPKTISSVSASTQQKRQYRRHPRPDA